MFNALLGKADVVHVLAWRSKDDMNIDWLLPHVNLSCEVKVQVLCTLVLQTFQDAVLPLELVLLPDLVFNSLQKASLLLIELFLFLYLILDSALLLQDLERVRLIGINRLTIVDNGYHFTGFPVGEASGNQRSSTLELAGFRPDKLSHLLNLVLIRNHRLSIWTIGFLNLDLDRG
jgi:hypothetical protein